MANILIVHAHHEPKSFTSALARAAAETLTEQGHKVDFSDLYPMKFDPVSDRRNFTTVRDPNFFKQQQEELYAAEHLGFAPEIEVEMQKLERCDLLVFSFPLWWFGLPAILKGWVDRVFAYGRIYARGRWYDKGLGRGKRAMVLITTGGGRRSQAGARSMAKPIKRSFPGTNNSIARSFRLNDSERICSESEDAVAEARR